MVTNNLLIISGHPDLNSAYTNRVILSHFDESSGNVPVRRLDALYPDYNVDVKSEQKALIGADVIVLQFP